MTDHADDMHIAINQLLAAMRKWGSEEDGIPDFAAAAYNEAADLVGERRILEEDETWPTTPTH